MTDGGGMVPRKAAWASLITVCGLVLLFSFKTPGAASLAPANGATGDQAVVDSGGTAAATAAPTAGATADTGTTDSSSGATTEATPAPSTTTTTAGYEDGTYTGSTISTRYGDVEVQVTISDGQITDVTALALPDRDNHSARISSQAEPILREEALTAQSANIDLLSGATYTSDGYEQSLQAALDQALG